MQVILDFDCTLSEGMVYDNLGNGNVVRAKQMTDLWWIAQFGGSTRIHMLEEFLRRLEEMGVTAFVCSHNNSEVIIEAFRRTNLSRYFTSDDENFRIIGNPGYDKGSRLQNHIDSNDVRNEDIMFIDDSAVNCNSVAKVFPDLKVHMCNATGMTKQDCDIIVQHFDGRLQEIGGNFESGDLEYRNFACDSSVLNDSVLNLINDGHELSKTYAHARRLSCAPTPWKNILTERSLNTVAKAEHVKGGSACLSYVADKSHASIRKVASGSPFFPMAFRSARFPVSVSAPQHDPNKLPQRHETDAPELSANRVQRTSNSLECPPLSKTSRSVECPPSRAANRIVRPMSPISSQLRSASPPRVASSVPTPVSSHLRSASPPVRAKAPGHPTRETPKRSQSISSQARRPDSARQVAVKTAGAPPPKNGSAKTTQKSQESKEPPRLATPLVSHPPLSKTAKCALAIERIEAAPVSERPAPPEPAPPRPPEPKPKPKAKYCINKLKPAE
jgi:hypothetical protein